MVDQSSFPTQTIEEIVSDADNTIELLSGVVKVSPSSRLYEYRKILAKYVVEGVPKDEKRNQVMCRALTELSSLSVIARGLATGKPSQEECKLLSEIVGGQVLPDEEKKNLARNSQLHLYIASILKASGTNVEFEEPDLLAHINGRALGVAAKRITSLKKFETRISEGEDQLRRAMKRGIVWIDISDAMLRQSGLFVFENIQELHMHQEEMKSHALQIVDRFAPKLIQSTHLADVIMHWITPRTISNNGSLETAEFLQPFYLYEPETTEGKVATILRAHIDAGLRELGQLQ